MFFKGTQQFSKLIIIFKLQTFKRKQIIIENDRIQTTSKQLLKINQFQFGKVLNKPKCQYECNNFKVNLKIEHSIFKGFEINQS